jgi:hypothetical protein
MRELLLMYKISENKKIRASHHYETYNAITLENESTVHADATINTGSSAGRILIVDDDDPDITLSFSIGLEDGGFEIYTYNDPLDAFQTKLL